MKKDRRVENEVDLGEGFMELRTFFRHVNGKPVIIVGGFKKGWEVWRRDNGSMHTVLSIHGTCKAALNSLAVNPALVEVRAAAGQRTYPVPMGVEEAERKTGA